MTVFDDGSDIEIEIEPDDPPRSGQWVDHEDFLGEGLTDAEIEIGNVMGEIIDVDDDTDSGL